MSCHFMEDKACGYQGFTALSPALGVGKNIVILTIAGFAVVYDNFYLLCHIWITHRCLGYHFLSKNVIGTYRCVKTDICQVSIL